MERKSTHYYKTWHGSDFHKRTNFEIETFNTRRKEIRKKGVVCSVRYKNKRCKMEYIGESGRQLKSE